jgi:hypothetical protein
VQACVPLANSVVFAAKGLESRFICGKQVVTLPTFLESYHVHFFFVHVDFSQYKQNEMEIASVLRVCPDLPAAYFLRYLNCLYHGEFNGALDSTHHYFDFSAREGGTIFLLLLLLFSTRICFHPPMCHFQHQCSKIIVRSRSGNECQRQDCE